MKPRVRRAFRAIAFLVFVVDPAASRAECPHDWAPISAPPPFAGAGTAIVYDDGSGPALFVAQSHWKAGFRSTSVFRWTGTNLTAAGDSFAMYVTAFGIYNGTLYAAGYDVMPGQPATGRIVRWNGHSWLHVAEVSPFASNQFVLISAITAYNGHLYIAGTFRTVAGVPVNNIARWNGTQWSDVGGGISTTNSTDGVRALQVFQGSLYAAGRFVAAGQAAADDFARWDDVQWMSVPTGLTSSGEIIALTTADDVLVLGGIFSKSQQPAVRNVASWDGAHLSALGSGFPQNPVLTLGRFNNRIYAGLSGSSDSVNRIVQFDGEAWLPTANTPLGTTIALVVYGPELFALGGYELGMYRWDENTWRPVLTARIASITPRTVHHGELVGTGTIRTLDGTLHFGLARWDGADWQPLSMEVISYPQSTPRMLNAAVSYKDDLIVGGRFSNIGGVSASNIARWTGAEWLPLNQGVDGDVLFTSLYQGEVIASGEFMSAGGSPATRIARWNGSDWSPLNEGLPASPAGLTVFNNELVAGSYYIDGSVALARWNGLAWNYSPVSWQPVVSLTAVGGLVYGGQDEGNDAFARVFAWDGTNSFQVGQFEGFADGIVFCVGEFNGDVVASSNFPNIDGLYVGNIARRTGPTWSGLGSGLEGFATHIMQFEDSLFVSGIFEVAGGYPTNGFARWSPIGPAIITQPEQQITRIGQQAAFAVSSADASAFQWRRNGVALTDDGHVTGATTPNLTITSVIRADAGQYDCVTTNACGTTTSNTAPLRVIRTIPGPPITTPADKPDPG